MTQAAGEYCFVITLEMKVVSGDGYTVVRETLCNIIKTDTVMSRKELTDAVIATAVAHHNREDEDFVLYSTKVAVIFLSIKPN